MATLKKVREKELKLVSDFKSKFSKVIRLVPDFPKPGIIFKDITPILANSALFKQTIDWLVEVLLLQEKKPDLIAGIDARGFIFGAVVADRLGIGFIPIRKPGKLPAATYSAQYELEYGTGTLEIHKDAVPQGAEVAIIDDLLATGGTAEAAASLIERCNAKVNCFCFLIELGFLNGKNKLDKFHAPLFSIQEDKD